MERVRVTRAYTRLASDLRASGRRVETPLMSAYRRPFSRNALASDGASASASSRKKQTSLPSELCVKIHTDKVDVGRLKPWINDRITELLGV